MKEVFISYSTKDNVQAETVRDVLEKNGISCWMAPRDIPGGSNYTKEIPNAIRGCKIFVLILSGNAQSSPWVLRELDSAVNSGKVILPFMLEDCDLNDEFNFLLTGAQRYAAYQKKAEALEKLVGRVRGVLEADSANPPRTVDEPVNAPAEEAPKNAFAQDAAPEKQTPPKQEPQPKAESRNVFVAVCPACGSMDIRKEPKKLICMDRHEKMRIFCGWLMAVPFYLITGIIAVTILGIVSMFVSEEVFADIASLVVIACFFASPFVTVNKAKKHIRNNRIRARKQVEACSCNRCNLKFNDIKDL